MSPVEHPSSKAFWRSLEDRADTPQFRRFVENEFPQFADEMLEPSSRRGFLKLMGASLALAGMTACRWPAEEILPFSARPEGYVPGTPQYFATAAEWCGAAQPLLAKSQDGRPIKIEGNPEHPASRGGSSALAQALVLGLYDPARCQRVRRRQEGARRDADWGWFEGDLARRLQRLSADRGAGLRVLAEASSSTTLAEQRRLLLARFPEARWVEYEPLSRDAERQGTRMAFGSPLRPQYHLDRAEVVVAFDEDLLLQHPDAVRQARDWVASRRPESGFDSRLYAFESSYSSTGSVADHRVPLKSGMIPVAVACLAAEIFLDQGLPLPLDSPALRQLLERFQFHPLFTDLDWSFARELINRPGRSLVVVGPRQPAEVHALAHLINVALDNVGRTVSYTAEPDAARPDHVAAIQGLADEISGGKVETLLVLGGNPAFDAPADLDFAGRLRQVPHAIHLTLVENETSTQCDVVLPRAHTLESWGDARDWRGQRSVIQPLIRPLYGGRTPAEVLSLFGADGPRAAYELVRAGVPGGDRAWRRALHDGFVEGDVWPTVQPSLQSARWSDGLKPFLRARDEVEAHRLELVFLPSTSVLDGRFASNGWLQELPDPLTKLTWDNAALIGPATAELLGVSQGDRIRIDHAGRSVELPVNLMPGQAPGSIGVALGYGRRHVGSAGDGLGVGVGFDVYPLRTTDALHVATVAVEKIRGRYQLATTQDHFAIERLGANERAERVPHLVHEMSLSEYRGQGGTHAHEGGHGSGHGQLWKDPVEYDGYAWGMAIDLNACTGCNACVIACQSENNIPVVGKDEVARGREMHWIRVDRYFSGNPETAAVSYQPVTCQHCENAPCEQVCPVAATVHDSEGLNVMIYNRCVGTRYCANNCPYKVRRFNWFNNHKNESAVEMMVHNPEVTVRARGVMEKCTFCVQRINAAKIAARNEGRSVRDGEITTACQQACPTQAISFGDLNDPHSHVAEMHHDSRAYAMLEEWNVRPRNRFLARLRNRDPRGGPADRS